MKNNVHVSRIASINIAHQSVLKFKIEERVSNEVACLDGYNERRVKRRMR